MCTEKVCHPSNQSQSAHLHPGWKQGDKITALSKCTWTFNDCCCEDKRLGLETMLERGPRLCCKWWRVHFRSSRRQFKDTHKDRKILFQTSTCLKRLEWKEGRFNKHLKHKQHKKLTYLVYFNQIRTDKKFRLLNWPTMFIQFIPVRNNYADYESGLYPLSNS